MLNNGDIGRHNVHGCAAGCLGRGTASLGALFIHGIGTTLLDFQLSYRVSFLRLLQRTRGCDRFEIGGGYNLSSEQMANIIQILDCSASNHTA